MKKYPLALFIGRFQPFHNGHLYSLKKALEVGESVAVGIGSSQECGTENNPWDYETRRKMIEAVLRETSLQGQSLKVEVTAIPDYATDEEWVRYVEETVRKMGYKNEETVIVGNNDWTNSVLKEAGFNVYESGLHNRDELEGTKIRKMMKDGDESWKERVPTEVVNFLKSD